MEEEVAGSALLSQNSGQNKRQANTHPHARPHCAGVFANRLGGGGGRGVCLGAGDRRQQAEAVRGVCGARRGGKYPP